MDGWMDKYGVVIFWLGGGVLYIGVWVWIGGKCKVGGGGGGGEWSGVWVGRFDFSGEE